MIKKITYYIIVFIFEIVLFFLQIYANGNALTILQAGLWLASLFALGGYVIYFVIKELLCISTKKGSVYQYSKKTEVFAFANICLLIFVLVFSTVSMKYFHSNFHIGALVITICLIVLENIFRTIFYLQQRKTKRVSKVNYDFSKSKKITPIACTKEEASNFVFTNVYVVLIAFLGHLPILAIAFSTIKGLLIAYFIMLFIEFSLTEIFYKKLFEKTKKFRDLQKKLKLSLILDIILNVLVLTLIILLCFNLESDLIRIFIFCFGMLNFLQKLLLCLYQIAKISAGMQKFLQQDIFK